MQRLITTIIFCLFILVCNGQKLPKIDNFIKAIQEINRLNTEVNKGNKKNEELENELKEITKKYNDLNSKPIHSNKDALEIERLNSQLNSLTAELKAKEASLNAKEEEAKKWQNEAKYWQNEVQLANARVDSISAVNEKNESLLKDANSRITKLDSINRSYLTRINDLEYDKAISKIKELASIMELEISSSADKSELYLSFKFKFDADNIAEVFKGEGVMVLLLEKKITLENKNGGTPTTVSHQMVMMVCIDGI